MHAWWSGSTADFCAASPDAVTGLLAAHTIAAHRMNEAEQLRAWRAEIVLLQATLAAFPTWQILLEYNLVRLGRQIDAVLLTDRAIFVLEFKIGAHGFALADQRQVEDYALDLFDFHAASRSHPIIPVLVASAAKPPAAMLPLLWHGIAPVLNASADSLAGLLAACHAAIGPPRQRLDARDWEAAPYRPVPNIIEAAAMLYRRHGVAEIAAARADIGNLGRTTDAILHAIAAAQRHGRHEILFITGIPGAGKTLCGLNTLFQAPQDAAFLTGNLPLVHVLREALARDAKQSGRSLRDSHHRLESAMQPLLGFLKDNVPRSNPPHEHVIVFDEAQRAWDAEFGRRRFGLDDSEAALFLDIMRRHTDWAVIVALVGNGQEINTGEAGLASWGTALAARPIWQIAGPAAIIGHPDPARSLMAQAPDNMRIDPALHLAVSVRQIRSDAASDWVEAVLEGDATAAATIAQAAGGVPFRLSRSLAQTRAALRRLARGSQRAGLVCSADAKRLRADGLSADFAHMDRAVVVNWFLNAWPDVRASDALEIPATQYACQGLELDYVGLCWGGDLIRAPTGAAWQARKFRGQDWQMVRREQAAGWQRNTYRVLLSRARYETIIFVPPGDAQDRTNTPSIFDRIAEFLASCGATMLGGTLAPNPAAPDPAEAEPPPPVTVLL